MNIDILRTNVPAIERESNFGAAKGYKDIEK